ncbi:uncharacterized protein ACHE_80013A [Aspergillus chevalieri]|uniref:C2H2-type domain-containing protein n=1 Tax=Aspergillus chevalieri TaxID=182096 RepID=A0A7R7VWK0_ASPCH|nr:uncharacterized protein ACHE_80013A [Aspergillus chevalieri]BCR92113.1 hypothetical protein ACHE_80013A [Aspergillus chevalieri]
MDLFLYNDTHRLWICGPCGFAVRPAHLAAHLANRHPKHPSAATPALRRAACALMLKRPCWDPAREPDRPVPPPPAPGSPPVPGLPVHPGYRCPHPDCAYIVCNPESLLRHRTRIHADRRPRGRQPPASQVSPLPPYRTVSCQRFFPSGAGSGFFQVTPPAHTERARQAATMGEVEFIRRQVAGALAEDAAAAEAGAQQVPDPDAKAPTEISPWLELTRWPEFLHGHAFTAVAPLAAPPDPTAEPLLTVFSASVERLIEAAYQSIKTRRINEFDQIRINSFLQRPRVWDRPILIQLRPSTYRAYRQVWQRLICFAYRTSRPNAAVQLGHQLTTAQLAALDRMETAAAELLSLPSPPLCTPGPGAADHPPWTTGGGPWVVIQTPRGGSGSGPGGGPEDRAAPCSI